MNTKRTTSLEPSVNQKTKTVSIAMKKLFFIAIIFVSLFGFRDVEAYYMEFSASDGVGGNTSVVSNTLDAVAPTLTTTSSSVTLYVEGGPLDGTPYLLKSSSPTTAYSGTTVFSIDSGYDSQHITGLVPGDYTFYARISNTADGGTVYLYAEIPVRVIPATATIKVTNNCSVNGAPAGSWTSNPAGASGSGASGNYTVTPTSSGTTYSLSFTPPTGYTGSTTPTSQLAYPGGTYLFTTRCSAPTSLPTVSISVNPSSLQCTDPLTSTAITWNVTDATSCSATGDWSGSKNATTGSHTENVTPSGSTSGATSKTYGITCTGPGGTASTTPATVSIGQCTAPQASVTLSANPTSIVSGGASTLSWTGTNVASCSTTADFWTSSSATSGSQSVFPSVTTTYTRTCTATSAAGGGTVTGSATVTVTPGASVSVSASPTSITSGQSSTISWSSTNATSCSAPWTTSTATSSTQSVSPATSTTYTMTCSGAGGSGTGSATVVVNASTSAPTVNVSASPSTITSGQSSVLTWSSSNATSCSATWTTSTATSGTQPVSPATSTTYSMTCSGAGGSGVGSATVTVGSSPSPFSYSLSNGGNKSVTKDGADVYVNQTITRTAVSGTQSPVTVAITSTLPSGVTASISNNPCTATCNSTITFAVTQGAQTGTFPVIVTGSAVGVTNQTTTFNLTVNPSANVTVSCLASPSPATVGTQVTWTAYPSGGTPPYTYVWSGTNFPSPSPSTNPFNFTYQTTGSKTAQVTVRDEGGTGTSATCQATQLQVNIRPTTQEF